MGGFYWAGAYVDEDYLYIGTDDGSAEGTSTNTHLLSIDKRTGKVIDDVALPGGGDIRCSVTCYEGKLYFTSKGGYFYEAEYDEATGDVTVTVGKEEMTFVIPLPKEFEALAEILRKE